MRPATLRRAPAGGAGLLGAPGQDGTGKGRPRALVRAPSAGGGAATGTEVQTDVMEARMEATRSLHRWLVDEKGMDDMGLAPQRVHKRRLGLVATRDVAKGAEMVRVPRNVMMSRRSAEASPGVTQVLEQAAEFGEVSDWETLALHLLLERAAGAEGPWGPYINSLPNEASLAQGLAHPLLWPEALVSGMFQGSPLLPMLLQRQEQCRDTCQLLLQGGADPQVVSLGSVQWASVMLLSRAFHLNLDADEGDTLADPWGHEEGETVLVPWADLINHSPDAGESSVLRFDAAEGRASLRAHQAYGAGAEVFDSYGPSRSPTQLFLDHGFVPDAAGGGDNVELPAAWLSIQCEPEAAEMLAAVGLPPDGTFFSLGDGPPEETLMAWVRAVVATEEELRELGWHTGQKRGPEEAIEAGFRTLARCSEPVSARNERAALENLRKVCEDRLAAYSTTLAADEAILAGTLPRTELPGAFLVPGASPSPSPSPVESMEALIESTLLQGGDGGAEAAVEGGLLLEVPESYFTEIGPELTELQGFGPGAVQRAERLAMAARASEKRALAGTLSAVTAALGNLGRNGP